MDGGVDRISSLPDPILHHILSFLEAKQAAQVSPASKRLNHVWTTLPYLDLGRDFFPDFNCVNKEVDVEIGRTAFVDQMLMRRRERKLSVLKFRLCLGQMDAKLSPHIDRWVHLLVECNIKELILETYGNYFLYDLPPVLLKKAASLHTLSLRHCKLPSGDGIKFSLQKLHLLQVFADDQVINNMIRVCNGLEELEIYNSYGFKRLDVSGQCKLKKLKVGLCAKDKEVLVVEDIFVEALNLEKLEYYGRCLPTKINIIPRANRLKELLLFGANISNTQLSNLISKLPFLETLMLANLNLKVIEISALSLKRLTLWNLFDFDCCGVGEAKIDAPNLSYFKYGGCLSAMSINKLVVPEVHLYITDFHKDDGEMDPDFIPKLVQFLHKFDYSDVLRIDCFFFKKLIFPAEMRLSLVAPLPNIKNLVLKGVFDIYETGKQVMEVVPDLISSLLWMCPNLNILSFKDDDDDDDRNPINISIKFTYDKLGGKEDTCLAGITVPLRCWRNSLVHVEYKLEGANAEVERSLMNYFISHANLLKRIVAADIKI